jgi:lipopolysaccharide transport system permease protein
MSDIKYPIHQSPDLDALLPEPTPLIGDDTSPQNNMDDITGSGTEPIRWSRIIGPERSMLSVPWKDIWAYRDLLGLLVRRDFVALYKQTILGPIWFVIQPLMMTFVFTLVFGNIAQLSTDGLPPTLFYLAGVTMWSYFQDSLMKTSETFTQNANIFGKVYFPRIIVPLSVVMAGLLKYSLFSSYS